MTTRMSEREATRQRRGKVETLTGSLYRTNDITGTFATRALSAPLSCSPPS